MEAVPETTVLSLARTGSAGRPSKSRSAVTNGGRLHVIAPGDNRWSRRFADVLAQIIADISDTKTELSEGQRQLVRRVTTLCIECEKMERVSAAGGDINLDIYGALTDRIGRAFHRLGLKRRAPAVMDLPTYLAMKRQAEQHTVVEAETPIDAEEAQTPVDADEVVP